MKTLDDASEGDEIVLRGPCARILATVVRRRDGSLDIEWDGLMHRMAATIEISTGRMTWCDTWGSNDVEFIADPIEPLPPNETWTIVLADGTRVQIVATAELEEEFDAVRWVACLPNGRVGGVSMGTAGAAVYAAGGAYGGLVRAIVPPDTGDAIDDVAFKP